MWSVTVGLECKIIHFFVAVMEEHLFVNLGFINQLMLVE
jgi:hypothetical protein